MATSLRHIAPIIGATLATALFSPTLQAAQTSASNTGTAWDPAVNSLLATGMYGFKSSMLEGVTIHFQKADAILPGLSPSRVPLTTQAITFSYEGSSGLLEFSAGYILSQPTPVDRPASVFLGIEPMGEENNGQPDQSWYMALNLSRSYQIDEDLALSFGNRALFFKNPFDSREGQLFSLLFSMPITYKNYLTITPELQWTRPLSPSPANSSADVSASGADLLKKDVFYGGVSIRFSY